MKLYHFPSPNPQKVTFALKELGIDCEIVPLDLAKGEQRQPDFLALNPFGRVPVLTDGDLTITESHAILAYLGEKTGRLWPGSAGERAEALQWLFVLSQHIMPAAGQVALRIRAKVLGIRSTKRLSRRANRHCSRSSPSSTAGSRQTAGCSAPISASSIAPTARY
jgi:glutathione S-transferase